MVDRRNINSHPLEFSISSLGPSALGMKSKIPWGENSCFFDQPFLKISYYSNISKAILFDFYSRRIHSNDFGYNDNNSPSKSYAFSVA